MSNRTRRLAGALTGGADADDGCRECLYIREEDLPAAWVAKMELYVMLIVRDPSAVKDVMQDLRVSLLRQKREEWNAIVCKERYVWKAARRAAYQWIKQRKKRNSIYENFMRHTQHKTEGELQDLAGNACSADDLARMLKPLGARRAEAFLRVHYWGTSHKETAVLMGITVGGVKKHLERADQYFQRLLELDQAPSAGSRLMRLFRRGERS